VQFSKNAHAIKNDRTFIFEKYAVSPPKNGFGKNICDTAGKSENEMVFF